MIYTDTRSRNLTFFSVVKVIKKFFFFHSENENKSFSLSLFTRSQKLLSLCTYEYIFIHTFPPLLAMYTQYVYMAKKEFFKYKANEIENFIAVYKRYTWNEYDLSKKKEERVREVDRKKKGKINNKEMACNKFSPFTCYYMLVNFYLNPLPS